MGEKSFIKKILIMAIGVLPFAISSCTKGSSNQPSESHEHTFSSEWEYDDKFHWHPCTCGHDIRNEEEHIMTSTVVEPTETTPGYTLQTCIRCFYQRKINEIDPLGYTVTWKNYDGEVLETDFGVQDGSMPSYDREKPTKPSDDRYSYVFIGWTPELEPVHSDVTYVACFEQRDLVFTVRWTNYNGDVLETDTYGYGDTPTYDGEEPVKPDDDRYSYTFSGWNPEVTLVTCNQTYVAQFEEGTKKTRITKIILDDVDESSFVHYYFFKGETVNIKYHVYPEGADISDVSLYILGNSTSATKYKMGEYTATEEYVVGWLKTSDGVTSTAFTIQAYDYLGELKNSGLALYDYAGEEFTININSILNYVYYNDGRSRLADYPLLDRYSISFYSSDESIFTVEEHLGDVSLLSPGNATLTVKFTCGDHVSSCTLNVTVNERIYPQSFSISTDTLNLKTGQIYQVSIKSIVPSNATEKKFTYTSSNEEVATVTNDYYVSGILMSHGGVIKAISQGSAIITATSENGVTATCTVIVTPSLITDIKLSIQSKYVVIGDTVNITTKTTPANPVDDSITWTSSDNTIATVSSDGNVTGLKEGNVTITAKSSKNVTGSIDLIVCHNAIEILNSKNEEITSTHYLGCNSTSSIYTFIHPYTLPQGVTYEVEDSSLISISSNGTITSNSKFGTTEVTVKSTSDPSISKTIIVGVYSESSLTIVNGETPFVVINTATGWGADIWQNHSVITEATYEFVNDSRINFTLSGYMTRVDVYAVFKVNVYLYDSDNKQLYKRTVQTSNKVGPDSTFTISSNVPLTNFYDNMNHHYYLEFYTVAW